MLRLNRLLNSGSIKYYNVLAISMRSASTNAETASKDNTFENIALEDATARKTINISTKIQSKLPARQPLLKNFLLGEVDKDLLAFPEVISREDMSKLLVDTSSIRNYFEQELTIDEINKLKSIPANVHNDIKNLGLYGINAPQNFEGHGYFVSESLMASEPETKSTDIALMLQSHYVIIDILNEIGTDKQKEEYLTKLANGTLIGATAVNEKKWSQNDLFDTTIEYDAENKKWILNGEKSIATNEENANLFLVIAQKNKLNVSKAKGMDVAFCIVNSSTPGVTVDFDKSNRLCTIGFNNVLLTEDNLLSLSTDASQIYETFSKYDRLRYSLVGFGLTKKIVNDLSKFCISNQQCGVYLKDMNIVRDKLSNLHCSAYAMESVIFYTAGLIDEFDKQDVTLESAVTKYFVMTHMWKTACAEMELLGEKSYTLEPSESNFAKAIQLYRQGEAIDSLRIYIGLLGLQHAGMSLNESIKKSRNPLFNPNHIFAKFLSNTDVNQPNSKQRLTENVHPSLGPGAQLLEMSIARLSMCVELLLTRHGNEITQHQVELGRITEIIALTYAMFASISRASRSYCIGLKLADHELLSALAICLKGHDRIKTLANDIHNGPYVTNDNNLQRLSKQILKSHGYFAEKPLTYNY